MFNRPCFHGYYYKHQKGNKVVCFIPGVSQSGSFIQVITEKNHSVYFGSGKSKTL